MQDNADTILVSNHRSLDFLIERFGTLKAGFHIIATIAATAEKNSSAIIAIYGFHMIAAIATIAEKVNEGRGDLRLTHRSCHSSNSTWRLRIVDSCLNVGFFILMGAFQRKRPRERQRTHRVWVREIFQKREFRYFAVGNAVHPGIVAVATIAGEWFPYDRYDR